MGQVKVQYAKTHLSALLVAVESGEEIVIARGDRPVARLVSVEPTRERELGFVNYKLPADFDEPLSDAELDEWEGVA